jgi:hypothetical protein
MAREEDTGMGTALSGLAARREGERSKNETRSTRSRGDRRDNIGPGLRPCDCSFRLEIVRDRTAKLEQRRSRLGCSSHVD